ncbi:MAG: hypothetical protein GY913_20015 [Proteobacteria bacterium]|nr:hypothetical protein [Pseudomonadota bacterium]MCP4919192.1 hypothetical protein [Pseudomonadota bacterium]
MTLLLLAAAQAASLESMPVSTRGEALSMRQAAETAGHDARLVRRYVAGQGWEYTVRIEGFADAATAESAATELAEASGMTLVILGELQPIAVEPPAVAGPVVEPGHPASGVILEHAVRAVGGRDGGAAVLADASGVRFVYVRTVMQDGVELRAEHQLLREASDLRLTVHGEDPVRASTTVVTDDGSWMRVDGERLAQDEARAREVLGGFEPEQLLALPLGFGHLVDTDPVWAQLETVSVEGEGGDRLYVLEAGADSARGLRVEVAEEDWRIVEVVVRSDSGEAQHAFADWRELDTGLVVPFDVTLSRDGAVVSRLEVQELALVDAHPAGSFALPETP